MFKSTSRSTRHLTQTYTTKCDLHRLHLLLCKWLNITMMPLYAEVCSVLEKLHHFGPAKFCVWTRMCLHRVMGMSVSQQLVKISPNIYFSTVANILKLKFNTQSLNLKSIKNIHGKRDNFERFGHWGFFPFFCCNGDMILFLYWLKKQKLL